MVDGLGVRDPGFGGMPGYRGQGAGACFAFLLQPCAEAVPDLREHALSTRLGAEGWRAPRFQDHLQDPCPTPRSLI